MKWPFWPLLTWRWCKWNQIVWFGFKLAHHVFPEQSMMGVTICGSCFAFGDRLIERSPILGEQSAKHDILLLMLMFVLVYLLFHPCISSQTLACLKKDSGGKTNPKTTQIYQTSWTFLEIVFEGKLLSSLPWHGNIHLFGMVLDVQWCWMGDPLHEQTLRLMRQQGSFRQARKLDLESGKLSYS